MTTLANVIEDTIACAGEDLISGVHYDPWAGTMRVQDGVFSPGSDSQCRRGPIPALPRYLYPPAAASLSEIVGLQKSQSGKSQSKKVNPESQSSQRFLQSHNSTQRGSSRRV